MTRRHALVLLLNVGMCRVAWAQDVRGRRIVGEVVFVRPTRILVKSIGERSYTILVAKATRVQRGQTAIPITEVLPGERVVVDISNETEPWVARTVSCRPR